MVVTHCFIQTSVEVGNAEVSTACLCTTSGKAGIEKHGGVHVFSRHSVGSLLVKRGCDIVTIRELMRRFDFHTTRRYLHISDSTKRETYEKYITI